MSAGQRINSAEDVVRIIYAMHWDMKACECWICDAARALGCKGTWDDLDWRTEGYGYVAEPKAPDLTLIARFAPKVRRLNRANAS